MKCRMSKPATDKCIGYASISPASALHPQKYFVGLPGTRFYQPSDRMIACRTMARPSPSDVTRLWWWCRSSFASGSSTRCRRCARAFSDSSSEAPLWECFSGKVVNVNEYRSMMKCRSQQTRFLWIWTLGAGGERRLIATVFCPKNAEP